jgi:hypothetical protein
VTDALKHAGRMTAGVLSAGLLARLGLPALAALVVLGVLLLVVICWIIGNADRSDRMALMMLALQGKASCLAPRPTVSAVPAPRPRRQPASSGRDSTR